MSLWHAFRTHILEVEGSTRALALMRMGLVATEWTRFAHSLRPFDDLDPARIVFGLGFFAATQLLFMGLFTRVAAVWNAINLLLIYFYWGHAQGVEPWTHHHVYAMVAFGVLLAMTPCGRSLSLDRWWALRRAEAAGTTPPAERGPLWATRLMAWQVVCMYLWTAWDKTYPGFFTGDRMEMIALSRMLPEIPDTWWAHAAFAAMGTTTVLLEWLLPFALMWRPSRRWAVPIGLALHGAFYVLLPVGTFSVTMWIYYLAFLDADAVHRVIDRLLGVAPTAPDATIGLEPAERSP